MKRRVLRLKQTIAMCMVAAMLVSSVPVSGAAGSSKQTKAVVGTTQEDETTSYLFAHFTGTEGAATDEQIYFSTSKDGSQWVDLTSNGSPVLTSNIGDKGVRDPYLLRSHDGEKFYLLATDLSIYYRGGWGNAAATTTGSTNLVIWESEDLIDWSEPRLVDVAGAIPGAGCAWAPEAMYDEKEEQYVVYWATSSSQSNTYSDPMNMYYATTEDFVTFSEPVKWIDREQSIIDTTMIYDEVTDMYYRASGDGQISIECSDSIYETEDGWTRLGDLQTIFNNTKYSGSYLEGPEFFEYCEDDWLVGDNGEKVRTWGLMCDQYREGKGYLPFRTTKLTDMTTSNWSTATDVNFGGLKKRHGTILAITDAEYEAIMKHYGLISEGVTEAKVLAEFSFDDAATGFSSDNAKATGTYTLADSHDGKALYLDGSSSNFLTVTDAEGGSLLTGATELTISYDMKPDRTTTNWPFYAAPNANAQTGGKEKYLGILEIGGTTTAERYNNTGTRPGNPSAVTGSDWYHVDVVVDQLETTIYVNGEKRSTMASSYGLPALLGTSSILYIGKANWGSGEYFKGYLDNFKIYNKAFDAEELPAFSKNLTMVLAQNTLDSISDITADTAMKKFPDYDGLVTWKSNTPNVVMGADGLTATIIQPKAGEKPVKGTLTAILSVYGQNIEKTVNITINPEIPSETPYGYMMVHFIEDSAGYAEKIYLDISRGDNPQQWDPLNSGKPILASNLGTTGVRDPFLTYNPETQTYYIIATDLRVFGGDNGGWGKWASTASTKMNVWESKDLITWSDLRQFDVALDENGEKAVELGMMWAPEATWVPDYYGKDKGAFVVYWSSNVYKNTDTAHTGTAASKIVWGVTTDFTQETYSMGGYMLDGGSAGCIDTTILQDEDTTYHITKYHSGGITMYSTQDEEWWLEDTNWKKVQSAIGDSRFGAVEGPAVFKDHNSENSWYLFVDDLPTPGYQPMYTNDVSKGWDYLDSPDYFLTAFTKHGGVISLTKGQYDAIRAADAVSAVNSDLGDVQINVGSTMDTLETAMPLARVNTSGDPGVADLPVKWDLTAVDTSKAGTYEVEGTVISIGANLNQWVGKNGSIAYNAEERKLYSSTAITVKATVNVVELPKHPTAEMALQNNPGIPTGSKEESLQSAYAPLAAKVSKSTKNSLKLTWNKTAEADGYIVFGALANTKKQKYAYEVVDILESNVTTSCTQTGLKKATYYKYIVQAYKMTDGKLQIVETSKTMYAATKGGKVGNVKSFKGLKAKVTLKKGKKLTLKAIEKKSAKKLTRYRKAAFECDNTSIATVSKKGLIKGKKKGKCNIYVYAQDGTCKKVKVTIK